MGVVLGSSPPRRTTQEQNLVAYIDNGKLFFCTSREILPEHELLFYYSREYSRQLGKTASRSLTLSHEFETLCPSHPESTTSFNKEDPD